MIHQILSDHQQNSQTFQVSGKLGTLRRQFKKIKQEAFEKCWAHSPHAHSADVASSTVARRLRIDVHDDNDDNDNA